MGLLKEFKEFALRGNVMDMAVGVIIGGAFGKIVSALTNSVLMPPIGYIIGGVDFTKLVYEIPPKTIKVPDTANPGAFVDKVLGPATIKYGEFLQTAFDFLIIAICVFAMVKTMNYLMKKKEEAPPPPAAPPADVALLTEIRDLLAKRG